MSQIKHPIIYQIGGEPGLGKSTIAQHLHDARPQHSALFHTDRLYRDWNKQARPQSVRRDFLSSGWQHSADFGKHLEDYFLATLPERLPALQLIVEGWHVTEYARALDRVLSLFGYSVPIRIVSGSLAYFRESGLLPSKNTAVFSAKVCNQAKQEILVLLRKKKFYHTYSDLLIFGSSNSYAKWQALSSVIPADNYVGKAAADIGCAQGYNTFRLSKLGFKKVYGVDRELDFLQTCALLNSAVYQANIDWVYRDVFFFQPAERLDLLLATSVFHYFREDQPRLLRHFASLLDSGGKLVLEVGHSPDYFNASESFVVKYARDIDRGIPCYFPNPAWIRREAASYGLELIKLHPSVKQSGDDYERTVYLFVKK